MDDGFALWPKNANIDVFLELLKELHPSLKFTVEYFCTSFKVFRSFYYFTPKRLVRN